MHTPALHPYHPLNRPSTQALTHTCIHLPSILTTRSTAHPHKHSGVHTGSTPASLRHVPPTVATIASATSTSCCGTDDASTSSTHLMTVDTVTTVAASPPPLPSPHEKHGLRQGMRDSQLPLLAPLPSAATCMHKAEAGVGGRQAAPPPRADI
eukprot:354453-Chlamydomonas_euryale.AAC.3